MNVASISCWGDATVCTGADSADAVPVGGASGGDRETEATRGRGWW